MNIEMLITILESRAMLYDNFAKMHEEQGLNMAAEITRARADEVKQILSYIKE